VLDDELDDRCSLFISATSLAGSSAYISSVFANSLILCHANSLVSGLRARQQYQTNISSTCDAKSTARFHLRPPGDTSGSRGYSRR
jgi:hypothetical protein